jgi:hypothetical protein
VIVGCSLLVLSLPSVATRNRLIRRHGRSTCLVGPDYIVGVASVGRLLASPPPGFWKMDDLQSASLNLQHTVVWFAWCLSWFSRCWPGEGVWQHPVLERALRPARCVIRQQLEVKRRPRSVDGLESGACSSCITFKRYTDVAANFSWQTAAPTHVRSPVCPLAKRSERQGARKRHDPALQSGGAPQTSVCPPESRTMKRPSLLAHPVLSWSALSWLLLQHCWRWSTFFPQC